MHSDTRADVIIIGGGVMGAVVAFELSRRGEAEQSELTVVVNFVEGLTLGVSREP